MDAFADGMIARGPTLAADRATWTGSLHILDLPSAQAAHAFIEREPYNRAGLFAQYVIRRFENRLGRTMWQSPGDSDESLFLVIAHLRSEAGEHASAFPAPVGDPIVHGDLLTPDGARPAGAVVALQAPTRAAVEAALGDRPAEPGQHVDVEIHDWERGGRR